MPRRMGRRAGRPGLLGTMARTAAVAGTATAVSGRVQQGQQQRAQAEYDQQQVAAEQAAAQQAQLAPQQPAAAPAAGNSLMDELERHAQMKSSGILDDAEFTAAKAKLLA